MRRVSQFWSVGTLRNECLGNVRSHVVFLSTVHRIRTRPSRNIFSCVLCLWLKDSSRYGLKVTALCHRFICALFKSHLRQCPRNVFILADTITATCTTTRGTTTSTRTSSTRSSTSTSCTMHSAQRRAAWSSVHSIAADRFSEPPSGKGTGRRRSGRPTVSLPGDAAFSKKCSVNSSKTSWQISQKFSPC